MTREAFARLLRNSAARWFLPSKFLNGRRMSLPSVKRTKWLYPTDTSPGRAVICVRAGGSGDQGTASQVSAANTMPGVRFL